MLSRWRDWVVHRFGLGPIWDEVLKRRVASGSWYYGDGATLLLLLGVQVVTGAVLALTYSPTPENAYESVAYITERQFLGWFVRGLHYWSAGLMVVMLFFHLFRVILLGSYKAPREGTWLTGVALFVLVLLMSFTGYVLRWDERAIYGIRVAVTTLYRVPLVGEFLAHFAQGGAELSALTLTRFYGVHILFIPLLLLLVVAYHQYLVVLRGTTSRTERRVPVQSSAEQERAYHHDAHSEERGEWFYPETVVKSGTFAAVVFTLAVVLTLTLGPRELMPRANLYTPAMPAEEWWFWWYSALIALLPGWLAPAVEVFFPVAVLLALIALPFLDRSPDRGWRKRPVAVGFVIACVLALLWLSWLRYRSPWTGWPEEGPPPVPQGVFLTPEAERGRHLFAAYGCTSCHPVAGHGRQVGTDLAKMDRRYSRAEFRNYVLWPPRGVAMPSYAGRIPEEDLERVVDFMHVIQTYPE